MLVVLVLCSYVRAFSKPETDTDSFLMLHKGCNDAHVSKIVGFF